MTLTEIKREAPRNVIRVHTNPAGSGTEVIDLNINTNVTVSNTRSAKIFRKTLVSLVCIFAAAFTIVLINVKGELNTLKAQMQRMDSKIGMLMSKYEKISSKLNRVRSQVSHDKFYESFTTPEAEKNIHDRRFFDSEEQSIDTYKKLNDSGLIYMKPDSQNTNPRSKFRTNTGHEIFNTVHSRNGNDLRAISNDGDTNENASHASKTTSELGSASYLLNSPVERANLTSQETNLNQQKETQFAGYESEDEPYPWTESRTSRARRDDGRGKKRRKNKRRPKRRRLVPLVATFIGAVPEQTVSDKGYIGPWTKRTKEKSPYDLTKFHLVDERKSIEVTVNGLYMISTQIFYVGPHTHYSYWILLNSEGQSSTQKLTKCSTVSNPAANEVSCHTSIVLPLQRGDRLHIQQQEYDRFVNLREGHSYVQLILLSSETNRKRTQ